MNNNSQSRARKLHGEAIVADLHCDTVYLFDGLKGPYQFAGENTLGHVDLPRLIRGGVNVQCFAVCVIPQHKPCGALRRTLAYFEHFTRVMGENKGSVTIIRDLDGLEKSLVEGKLAALLTVEGGEALEGELEVLHSLYRLGMRGMGLTWNYRNELADGVDVGAAAGGLTKFGRAVVSEMNRLGIMVDASHLSPRSFYDVLEHSSSPVVVTHANAAGLCSHRRNLDDNQLHLLREQGGVIGICFYPGFLNSSGSASMENVLDHFCYIAERFGTDILAVGSDFDGIDKTVTSLPDVSALPALTAGLLARGFSDVEVRDILGGNFIRVLGRILKRQEF
jgi:membrane dipeptidase